MRIFLAGVMQGSQRTKGIAAQDYRAQLAQVLRRHVDGVELIDPYALHPDSVEYGLEQGCGVLLEMAEQAARADALIAYVPEASMGTAIEMWQAHRNGRAVFVISPLRENWVVRCLSSRAFETLDQFTEFVASGEFRRAIES